MVSRERSFGCVSERESRGWLGKAVALSRQEGRRGKTGKRRRVVIQPAFTTTTSTADNKADKTRGRVRIVLYALGAASLVLAVALLSAHARRELRRLAPSVEEEGEGEGRQGEEEEEGERDDEMEQGGGRGGGGPRGAEEERK